MTKQRAPGPKYMLPSTIGQDNHDPTREKAPGFSMKSRRTLTYKSGPGPYFIESGLTNKGRNTREGFALKGRSKQSLWGSQDLTPGPSSTVDVTPTQHASPRYSFGLPRKVSYKSLGPGPNSYNIPSTIGQGRKTSILGREGGRSFHYDYAKSPGPRYNFSNANTLSQAPAFSMGKRLKAREKTIYPGPNLYNPPHNGTVKTSPRFSIGLRHHDEVIPMADVSD